MLYLNGTNDLWEDTSIDAPAGRDFVGLIGVLVEKQEHVAKNRPLQNHVFVFRRICDGKIHRGLNRSAGGELNVDAIGVSGTMPVELDRNGSLGGLVGDDHAGLASAENSIDGVSDIIHTVELISVACLLFWSSGGGGSSVDLLCFL